MDTKERSKLIDAYLRGPIKAEVDKRIDNLLFDDLVEAFKGQRSATFRVVGMSRTFDLLYSDEADDWPLPAESVLYGIHKDFSETMLNIIEKIKERLLKGDPGARRIISISRDSSREDQDAKKRWFQGVLGETLNNITYRDEINAYRRWADAAKKVATPKIAQIIAQISQSLNDGMIDATRLHDCIKDNLEPPLQPTDVISQCWVLKKTAREEQVKQLLSTLPQAVRPSAEKLAAEFRAIDKQLLKYFMRQHPSEHYEISFDNAPPAIEAEIAVGVEEGRKGSTVTELPGRGDQGDENEDVADYDRGNILGHLFDGQRAAFFWSPGDQFFGRALDPKAKPVIIAYFYGWLRAATACITAEEAAREAGAKSASALTRDWRPADDLVKYFPLVPKELHRIREAFSELGYPPVIFAEQVRNDAIQLSNPEVVRKVNKKNFSTVALIKHALWFVYEITRSPQKIYEVETAPVGSSFTNWDSHKESSNRLETEPPQITVHCLSAPDSGALIIQGIDLPPQTH